MCLTVIRIILKIIKGPTNSLLQKKEVCFLLDLKVKHDPDILLKVFVTLTPLTRDAQGFQSVFVQKAIVQECTEMLSRHSEDREAR